MKRLLIVLFAVFTSFSSFAQVSAREWVASGAWRNGFTGASPDKTVNINEFYSQYHKNPNQWYALFKWLQNTDVLSIPAGKHPIPGSTLVVSSFTNQS